MKTLDEIAATTPFRKSVALGQIDGALAFCKDWCPGLEHEGLAEQHDKLKNAEHALDIRRKNNNYQHVRETLAAGLLLRYHADLLDDNVDEFGRIIGIGVHTKRFDTHFYGGTLSFRAFMHRNVPQRGFTEEAELHYDAALDIWPTIEHAHRDIAFRHARMARLYHDTHRLKRPNDFAYIENAVRSLERAATLKIFPRDRAQVVSAANTIYCWIVEQGNSDLLGYEQRAADVVHQLVCRR